MNTYKKLLSELLTYELSPFFKYACYLNPSTIVYTWNDPNQRARVHRVFENCVSCNIKRLNQGPHIFLELKMDTYFCRQCKDKVIKVVQKYDENFPAKKNLSFNKILFDKTCLHLKAKL